MPRLGGNSDEGNSSRREATAYAAHPSRFSPLLWIFAAFVLFRILFHDYRLDARTELLSSGLSKDEVDRYVPPTAAERRNYDQKNELDLVRMKKDIEYLFDQVEELKRILNETNNK